MKLRSIIYISVIFILMLGAAERAVAVDATVKLVSDIKEGNGSYDLPYVINSREIKFRVEVTGVDKENTLYWPQIHMDGYRSCATQFHIKDMNLEQVTTREFSYTADMAGWYYLRVDINVNGSGYVMQNFETHILHVYCRVPTSNQYTEPYNPPINNQRPVARGRILNTIRGSGSYPDPFIIDSPIVKFRIDETYDPDGSRDISEGLFLWAIHMYGHHPVYANGQEVLKAEDTYLYYNEMEGTVYQWDTRERPATDGYYMLFVTATDRHGEKGLIPMYFFRYDGDTPTNPVLSLSTSSIDLGTNDNIAYLTVNNIGANGLSWSATVDSSVPWVKTISPSSGYLNAGAKSPVQITVDRSRVSEGSYQCNVYFQSNGGSAILKLLMNVQLPPSPPKNITILNP
ncbi:hypothetical protein JXB12_12345 [candidate division KSB1 bacterium]|nr:hypothetical protein [candidate division KSB1 bacterium]